MKIEIILLLTLFTSSSHAEWFSHFFQRKKPFTILFDAAGDAAQSGRTIDNNFESSINFSIAQTLKNYLNASCPHVKVLINRTPTEVIAPLQNAQFANKLNVDFYIHICSVKTSQKSSITFYQFSYHEKSIIKKDSLGFYPYDQLYLMYENQSTEWADIIKKYLDQKAFDIFGIYKIPFKALMGINAPAVALEIGISCHDDLNSIVTQLNYALQQFLFKM